MDDTDTEDRHRKERSPSFPFISLGKAIDRAASMGTAHRKNPVRLVTLADTWGYAASSSGLQQTAAALKSFGLLEDSGRGEDRKLALSPLALRILYDSRPGAKEQAVREAAIRPRLFREYADLWLRDMPSDSHRLSELELDRGFTPQAAKLFLRAFDETMSFAGLPDEDKVSSYSHENDEDADPVQDFPLTVSAQSPAAAARLLQGLEPRSAPMPSAYAPRATLPLPEGVVALEIPTGLSKRSYAALKAWVELMVQLAEAEERPESDT